LPLPVTPVFPLTTITLWHFLFRGQAYGDATLELLATYDAEQREQYGESEADICDICRGTCLRCHITHILTCPIHT